MKGLPVIVSGLVAVASIAVLARTGTPEVTLTSFATSLVDRTPAQRHNALLAIRKINGAVIQPGETFSFNRTVGTASRDAGYLRAPVSYNGLLVESWGGGVCQVSTTLYNAALTGGLEIVERSRHRFAPGYVSPGRDAAVAFDTIDLKFRNTYSAPIRIRATINGNTLMVSMIGAVKVGALPEVVSEVASREAPRTYQIGLQGGQGRLRNSGKPGYEVRVVRVWKDRREQISDDIYPVMHRIVERR